MSAACPYPTIRFIAWESRIPKQIFVPDPSMRGRYVLTDRSVALVPCPYPTCKSIPGEPCKFSQGYGAGTHAVRREAATARHRGVRAQDVIHFIEPENFDWEAYQ